MHTARTKARGGVWRMAGAAAAVLAAAGQAHAFYWFGWPGSQLPPEPALVAPPSLVSRGPAPDTQKTPGQPGGPPVPVDKPPVGPPTHTPEPATGVIALVGLGAVAARKWWKR